MGIDKKAGIADRFVVGIRGQGAPETFDLKQIELIKYSSHLQVNLKGTDSSNMPVCICRIVFSIFLWMCLRDFAEFVIGSSFFRSESFFKGIMLENKKNE